MERRSFSKAVHAIQTNFDVPCTLFIEFRVRNPSAPRKYRSLFAEISEPSITNWGHVLGHRWAGRFVSQLDVGPLDAVTGNDQVVMLDLRSFTRPGIPREPRRNLNYEDRQQDKDTSLHDSPSEWCLGSLARWQGRDW